ncbi:ATP-dependent zinc protease family protein [Vibrio genomosp. F10]|uniref:Peptidase n=1 Tax=Vibrio genomosp. F10 str. ZF-129 TaxID=1187848 RepID=A0A1E5BD46_9VIBR|nr:RimK/LysX family protein [Vibrio genomosp. F10]OEE33068.1 peptidase [Vibrio genomosp. F10 str. ZF-129]OEE98207.1 peptidase [Vibrio genomosp. F10 str. 9ZC157]OEF04529.1 peptidase [Vibrio genomosp. F10 str. 9ZB36]
MKKMSSVLVILSTFLFSLPSLAVDIPFTTQSPAYDLEGKVVLGRTENVYLNDSQTLAGVPFVGKIDTGADTTSMHAENIHVSSEHPEYQDLKDDALMAALVKEVEKDKTLDYFDWDGSTFSPFKVTVTFTVHHPYTGDAVVIKAPLERVSVIRSRTSSTPLLRPTVKIPMTIAGHEVKTDVNLTDRSNFTAPVLIGKTFLVNHAWVFAGYDYLQEQPNAKVVGKKEQVAIKGVPLNVSFSLENSHSILHAKNIDIDKKRDQVTFDIVGSNGEQKEMLLPLVRMLNISGHQRPLVYVPVQLDSKTTQYWLVYLKDRSGSSSQLRVGTSTISESFMIDTRAENLLGKGAKRFLDIAKSKQPMVVSPQEHIVLDGFKLDATPSFTVKTPLLKVVSFEVTEEGKDDYVEYFLTNADGEQQKVKKKIEKNLRVGETIRPTVLGQLFIAGEGREQEYAIDVLDSDEKRPYFILGQKMAKDGVFVNTRADHLLQAEPLFKAGHIETVQVEGMTFPAKLDTGADVSSMNAVNIKQFKKDGHDMVTFTYQNSQGDEQELTKPVIDVMRIKAKKGEKPNIRPVVEMNVKLGELEKTINVNLQDRSRFEYSMILGKNFLKHGAVVSSDENYLLGKSAGDNGSSAKK